ncbi:MAG: hypothetical protein KGV56_05115 [Gammaproteobacteria bacterium]|nr:hypothetical protein [Gammaproteobacteria bacterium]
MNIFKQVSINNIKLDPYPFQKELIMEAYLIENTDVLTLDNDNFESPEFIDEEVALKGSGTLYNGRIDILIKYSEDYVAIVELKKEVINENTLKQLEGYLKVRKELIKKYPDDITKDTKFIGIMVGTSICPKLQEKLQNGYTTSEGLLVAGIVLKRYKFEETKEVFVLSETFCNFKNSRKDFSKYSFQKQTYNKGRLVHAVVKHYVSNNPNITFIELQQKFPNCINSQGVFTTKDEAMKIFNKTERKRHYINPNEFIQLSDVVIATSTQWSVNTISEFIKIANKLDSTYKIQQI